jgi:hypothetical protein
MLTLTAEQLNSPMLLLSGQPAQITIKNEKGEEKVSITLRDVLLIVLQAKAGEDTTEQPYERLHRYRLARKIINAGQGDVWMDLDDMSEVKKRLPLAGLPDGVWCEAAISIGINYP